MSQATGLTAVYVWGKPKGKVRLCLDPTHLNKYVVGLRHNAQILDALLPSLGRTKALYDHRLHKQLLYIKINF